MDDSGNNHIYLALVDAEKKIANDHTTIRCSERAMPVARQQRFDAAVVRHE